MLLVQKIRENRQSVVEALERKNFYDTALLDEVIALDAERKQVQQNHDDLQSRINSISKEIGQLFGQGKQQEANALKEQTPQLKEDVKRLHAELLFVQEKLKDVLIKIPNLPHSSVPAGKTPEDNELRFESDKKVELSSDAKPHWELIGQYGLADMDLGVKITGAGFPVYKKRGARLQRALISYFLDQAIEAGYEEVIPPLLVNEDTAFGTGQLPDKEGQMYHIQNDKFYLIPTAEVPITNIYRDVILEEDKLPIKHVGYTPCFRREAGSYGKDVRGLNRIHQFDKVEIVQIQHPDRSYDTLEEMVAYVEGLLKKLELPYRIVKLCGGDMSFTSALTYDFEVYSAAQQRWLEVSSVSNFETFQSNRMKLRFRDTDRKTHLAHTLNGSALALPRIVAALLENNQQADGILVPEVLHDYTGFKKIEQ